MIDGSCGTHDCSALAVANTASSTWLVNAEATLRSSCPASSQTTTLNWGQL